MMQIRVGVVPAAGLGTRFLPFTKSVPKELLPIINKPAIQYVIEEGHSSGLDSWCIITSDRKEALRNYLTRDLDLEKLLTQHRPHLALDALNNLLDQLTFNFIEQQNPRGLGHAISLARDVVGNHYFGVLLPDDIIASPENPGIAQLIAIAQEFNATVIAVQEVPREQSSSYGMIAIKQKINDQIFEVDRLVEKPKPEDAPSNMAIIGRYVLSPRIFEILDNTKPGSGGEIQLTDAIDTLAQKGERVLACKISGTRFDVGVPSGWIKAIDYYGK